MNKKISTIFGITIIVSITVLTGLFLVGEYSKLLILETEYNQSYVLKRSFPGSSGPGLLSQEDLYNTLTVLNVDDNFEVRDEGQISGMVQGCRMNITYTGIVRETNYYARQETQYADPLSADFCEEGNLIETYDETYWVGEKIFNRQYEDKNFEELSPVSKIRTAMKPREYLKYLILDPQKINLISVENKEEVFEVKATAGLKQEEDISGEFILAIGKKDNKIIEFSYSKTNGKYTMEGKAKFKYPASEINLPSSPDLSFLLTSFDDIVKYSNGYVVNTENYMIFFEDSLVTNMQVITLGDSKKNTSCYPPSDSNCQGKINDLRNYSEALRGLIETARPIFCSVKETKTGSISEIYKNHLVFKISDFDRNPRQSDDYSIEIDFVTKGEKRNNYSVRLKIGKEYCYDGVAEDGSLNDLVQKLNGFVNSFTNQFGN